ncbi:MAG: DUF3137 domain-containing protein [Planctomycetota bacterium]
MAEAKLTDRRGSGKNRRTVTVFDGVFVLFTVAKSFSGKTVIRRDAGLFNPFQSPFGGLERIALEDPVFEKRFEVYGTDQVEARTLLTTSFMERLEGLARALYGKQLQAAFYDDRLLIMLSCSNNRFEPSVSSGASLKSDLIRFERDIMRLLAMADQLDLANDSGL